MENNIPDVAEPVMDHYLLSQGSHASALALGEHNSVPAILVTLPR